MYLPEHLHRWNEQQNCYVCVHCGELGFPHSRPDAPCQGHSFVARIVGISGRVEAECARTTDDVLFSVCHRPLYLDEACLLYQDGDNRPVYAEGSFEAIRAYVKRYF